MAAIEAEALRRTHKRSTRVVRRKSLEIEAARTTPAGRTTIKMRS